MADKHANALNQAAPKHPELALRLQAETIARNNLALSLDVVAEMTPADTQLLFHELRVHQIELEMQNEELRRTQLALTQERARYFDLYDLAPIGYCTISPTGLILQANFTVATLLGATRSELIQQPISRFIVKEDQDIYYLHRKLLMESGQAQSCELRLLKHDGTPCWAQLAATVAQDDDGSPVLRVVLSDITAQHQAEEARRQREQYLRALLDNFPFMVWLKDDQSRFLAVNKAFASSFGWPSPESLMGRNDFDIVPSNRAEQYRADDQAVLASGRPRQVEEMTGVDAQSRWVETYKSPVTLDGRMLGTVGFARNISARKRTETALINAMAEAEKANRAKSRFLAAASHDLRQPLAALALYVGVLKSKMAPDQGQLVGKIQECVHSMSELLTDLLDLSMLDAGVITPKISDFSIDELLLSLISIHSAEADLKGLRLRSRGCGAIVHTDATLLRRILSNYLVNALRYTHRGGVLVACRRHQGKTWVEVWDTGIGIAADQTEIIFEEFRQLGDDARNRGSGLGLAIVAKTATLLGLQIRLRSQPGRGSMFAIELPVMQDLVAQEPPAPAALVRSLRIAVLDDNAMVRHALALSLESHGHQVLQAATIQELMERLGAQAPDILITDYRLANAVTGFNAIEAARAVFGADLPALVITGDTDPSLIRSMVARGISVHYKPLQMDVLQALIVEVSKLHPPHSKV